MLKTNAKLNQRELSQVAGGTIKELEGLLKACNDNPIYKKFVGVSVHVSTVAIATAYAMEGELRNMGIDATISVGVGGTGAFSKHNVYYDRNLGRRLSQSEVEDRLRQTA